MMEINTVVADKRVVSNDLTIPAIYGRTLVVDHDAVDHMDLSATPGSSKNTVHMVDKGGPDNDSFRV